MKEFFKIRDKLLDEDHERRAHLAAIDKLREDPNHIHDFDFLYTSLSILDSKASALLTFNSIILAGVSIFQNSADASKYVIGYGICMIILLISCILCMSIIWIHWSSTADFEDSDNHLMRLFDVRYRRTRNYRLAWWLGVISLFVFLIIKSYEILTQA